MSVNIPQTSRIVSALKFGFSVAPTMVRPRLSPVASPVVLMLPTLGIEELQDAEAVRSSVVPSLHVPVAANCLAPPTKMEGLAGLISNDTSTGAVTVKVAEELR